MNNPIFAVSNIRKIKTISGCINVSAHNLRQRINKSLKEFIDPNLSHLNVYEGVQDYKEFTKKYDEIIESSHIKRKIQKNASRIIEFFFSFSHKFSENWQNNKNLKEKIDNYFRDCKEFITKKYNKVIISSAIHFDETTPHIHFMCVPLIFSKDGKEAKFSSSEFLGGKNGLRNLHTDFHNEVGKKYGLSRGIEGSRVTHIELKQYKAIEKKKLLDLDNKQKEMTLELEKIEKERLEAERIKRETEIVKTRMESMRNDVMKRDAELSKKEQKLLAVEKDVPVQTPEIPIPTLLLTETYRKSWRESVQKMVNKSFNIIIKAYQSIKFQYDKLSDEFKKLTTTNKILISRAEKAEKDLIEKPINEIISEREKKKKIEQGRNNSKNGISL
jgi:hypothetical protein